MSRSTKQNNNLGPGFAGCRKSLELLAIGNSQLRLSGPSRHFLPIFTAVSGSNMGHLVGWLKTKGTQKNGKIFSTISGFSPNTFSCLGWQGHREDSPCKGQVWSDRHCSCFFCLLRTWAPRDRCCKLGESALKKWKLKTPKLGLECRKSELPKTLEKHYKKMYIFAIESDTLRGTITYPTKREVENHRLKSAGWDGTC